MTLISYLDLRSLQSGEMRAYTRLRQESEMKKQKNYKQLSKMFTINSSLKMCTGETLADFGYFKA